MTTIILSQAAGLKTNTQGRRYVAAMDHDTITSVRCSLISAEPLFYMNTEEQNDL